MLFSSVLVVKAAQMTAGIHNIILEQGATFRRTIVYKVNKNPVNLTGYSARLQVRTRSIRTNQSRAVVFSLTSAAGGGLTIDAENGEIEIFIAPETSRKIGTGVFVYDLELESSPTEVIRLLQGNFEITYETTY